MYLRVNRLASHSDLVFHFDGGQHEAKPAVSLVTRVGKIDPSCLLGINHFDHTQCKNCFSWGRKKGQEKVKIKNKENRHDSQEFTYCVTNPAAFPSQLSK